jgi:peptidoglycan hydrolase-like protein with peptidoglycan-binding domain
MSSLRTKVPMLAVSLLLTASLALATTSGKKHSAPTRAKTHKAPHRASKKSRKGRARGQQAIDGERAREIQQALVREHYMSAEPTGEWNAATQEAMRRYQADQGWQSKTVPDSRALIRLGLGPDHDHLLNPETAMTTEPQLPHGTQKATRVASPSAANSSTPVSPGQDSTPETVPVGALPELSPAR